MPAPLICASKRSEDINFCRRVAELTNLDFVHSVVTENISNVLDEHPNSLVFWDIDSHEFMRPALDLSLSRMTPAFSRLTKPKQIFGLADSPIFELPDANRVNFIGHYCLRKYDAFAERWISKLCMSMVSDEMFGLHHYKDPQTTVQTIELKDSKERPIALKAIENLLRRRNMNERATSMTVSAIDELLMNAIFDAPIDKAEKNYRKEVSRHALFPMNGNERVLLSVAFNQDFGMVSVRDGFGSFSPKKALEAARKDYSEAEYRSQKETKTAGLGLHGIAASGLSFIIRSDPEKSTEALIAFPFYKTFKETKTSFRSFSLA
jgi:hypothetical protein